MRVRKQCYHLTPEDLDRAPVWRFVHGDEDEEDQDDEATVRPFDCEGEVDPADGGLLVRAEFRLADGSLKHGVLFPAPAGSDLGDIQPVIIMPGGPVMFWLGMYPTDEAVAAAYARLGKNATEVFPVQFRSIVPIKGGPVSGEIPGFLRLNDFKTRRTSIIR